MSKLNKNIISQPEEDGDSIFLGKIKLEDLQSQDLIHQLEEKCDDLLKQNFLKGSELEVNELLDSVDIVENELDSELDKEFSKKLGIRELFWQKVLGLLNFFNEALNLNLDLKLTNELTVAKEKQKRKSLLFSFLDAIYKKLFKKELTLEEMLELQMKALEEQLGNEDDPEIIRQIKEQLEFLMELKAKLFKLSLEQGLTKTMEWLLTVGAMRTVHEMARGKYGTNETLTTKRQWNKVDSLLGSGKPLRQIGNVTQNNQGAENVKTKPFAPIKDQNNNLNLIPLSQNIAQDNSGFLKLLYSLLLLANVYGAQHMMLGMGGGKEVETSTQKPITNNNKPMVNQSHTGSVAEVRQKFSNGFILEALDSNQTPKSKMQEVHVQFGVNTHNQYCSK